MSDTNAVATVTVSTLTSVASGVGENLSRAVIHVCFVPVKCVTVVRFNRYQIVSLYDPLGTFGEIERITLLSV